MWAYAKAITLVGPVGCGQLTKMVNQICLAGLTQALAEGLNFAARAGLDAEKVLGVISKGAAQSWMMDNRSLTMLANQFDFGFAVDWMRKDLSIALDEARRNGASLPVTALVDQFLSEVQRMRRQPLGLHQPDQAAALGMRPRQLRSVLQPRPLTRNFSVGKREGQQSRLSFSYQCGGGPAQEERIWARHKIDT